MPTRDACNAFRDDGSPHGHYESYFVRANHPTRPLAFWIRYTTFCPRGDRERAVGELWAVYFDGERPSTYAVKQVFPLSACRFSRERLDVRIGDSTLDDHGLSGRAELGSRSLAWSLRYTCGEQPLLLLPERLYDAPFPKAKALVPAPLSCFSGALQVGEQQIEVDRWLGSQNHNWGAKHTDRYAWGQVAGFDDAEDVFLECATARVRVGPVLTPPMSPLVLRVAGEELRFNSLAQSFRARARYAPFRWTLRADNTEASVDVTFEAPATHFVALPYDNPPGGLKVCLNSKLASCRVELRRKDRPARVFTTAHRGAFEILQDDPVPGVATL
jgi:hypothetical protein